MKNFLHNLLLIFIITTISCGSGSTGTADSTSNAVTEEFRKYWYAGDAEITNYELQEARYGELHEGNAVLIFVTEDFSKSKQVKLDDPEQKPKDKVSILKLNMTKKFNTGIYPYSLMQSVFTPVDHQRYPHSLKVSTSAQEWCGHTFTQLNLDGNQYKINGFSYFESEGDTEKKVSAAVLEDEIWNLIRLAPATLPTGTIDMIPGTLNSRLGHQPLGVEKVSATLEQAGGQSIYTLKYPASERTLGITFNTAFPHEIIAWEENKYSGFGPARQKMTTKATAVKSLKIDYWTRNGLSDLPLRKELGLEP